MTPSTTEPRAIRPSDPAISFLFTASEAYPALERAVLDTRTRFMAGFRVFDPSTILRSPEARQVGETWFDLLVHTLDRGVEIRLWLSDFDPVVRPALHRMAWRNYRQVVAAAEMSSRVDLMTAKMMMHPSRVGPMPRAALLPKIRKRLMAETRRINALPIIQAQEALRLAPHLRPLLAGKPPELQPKLWPIPPLVPATHHQKLAVFDETRLFIGGLDLNERRYDTKDHDRPADETWHDIQVLVSDGQLARDAATHLERFGDITAGTAMPGPSRILRTLSAKRRSDPSAISPKPKAGEIEDRLMSEIARSETLIYLESQFFRSVPIARALARRAAEAPGLTLLLVVPGAPEDVAFEGASGADARYGEYLQAKCLGILQNAFAERVFVMAPAQPVATPDNGRATIASAPLVYLHAKTSIFDDRTAIVSSANLNGRSLRWDTEAGIAIEDPHSVRHLRARCLDHWLAGTTSPELRTPDTMVSAWRDLARRNADIAPEGREGFVLPYAIGPARRFGRNLPGVPEEMV
ncbi:MAG: phospholipase D-like domain-containing protein [Pseudomonadota bacterium]